MQSIDIDSNYELIHRLEPFVRDKATSYAEFADAVHKALPRYLPELVPHEQHVLEYLVQYYGVTDAPGLSGPAGEDLSHLVPPPPSVQAGPPQTVAFPQSAALSGTVIDDTYQLTEFALRWSTVSGPAEASFDRPQAPNPTVLFPGPGRLPAPTCRQRCWKEPPPTPMSSSP